MFLTVRARWIVTLVALVLLLPILGIPLQSKTDLENFHNRTLPAWPSTASFLSAPQTYFQATRDWLAFRVYPIIEASILEKNLLMFALDTPPQRRITMAANGFIFLNGTDEQHLNNILEMVCVQAHSQARSTAFENALTRVAVYSRVTGMPVDVEVIPTSETLYGDHLPSSVPLKYRIACGERASGHSPLMQITAPPPVHYVFPFADMRALRDDDAFFPKGNWHADGLSLKIARDDYLKSLGIKGKIDETIQLGVSPSELLATYGITKNLPIYRIINHHVIADSAANAALHSAIAPLFNSPHFVTNVYRNNSAIDPETILILSDSYGNLASAVFAGAFRRVLQVMANDTKSDTVVKMIALINREFKIDRVLVLSQEGNTDRIVGYAAEFDEALATDGKR